jgi:DnaK suppressor protein
LKEVDVTAAKKAAPPSPKKATAPKGPRSAKAAPKRSSAAKSAAKRTATSPKASPKKAAPAGARSTAAAKKATAAAKKRPPSARKSAAAGKKGPTAAKKAAPVAKKSVLVAKKAAPAKKAAVPAPPKRPSVGPYAKDAKFLEEQRLLLLEERAVYSGQAVDLRAEADSLALEREPGDVQFDEESGEGGTVTVDRERNLALSAQASAAVEEIDDALRKIERKTYGGCERCHQAIPKARLRALPFARLCVACKSGGLSRR